MNHKEYLLGLLDGSHTLSNEGIGLVLARLEALERVAEVAEEVFASPSMLLVERTVGFNQPHVNLKNALAALEEDK